MRTAAIQQYFLCYVVVVVLHSCRPLKSVRRIPTVYCRKDLRNKNDFEVRVKEVYPGPKVRHLFAVTPGLNMMLRVRVMAT